MEALEISGKTYFLSIKSFDDLDTHELYEILKVRQEVFVVEQDCPYLDVDGKDLHATHVMLYNDKTIAAYTRVLAPGVSYDNYSSIGRVLNGLKYRSQGIGKVLMEKSIQATQSLYPNHAIKISAQSYLLKFYQALGFKDIGEEYLEDDIPHKAMILE